MNITHIKLSELKPPVLSVRKNITAESVVDLVESIKTHGIIEPIIVKKTKDGYEVVAGHRRSFAAELAGLETIPCIIRDFTGTDGELVKLEENIRRRDINPIEEAHFFNALVEHYKISVEELAKRSGRSTSYIYERLSIMKWPADILSALEQNLITYSVARELRQIDNDTVRKNYVGYAIDSGCSPAIANAWLREFKSETARQDVVEGGEVSPPSSPPDVRFVRQCPICKQDIESKDAQIAYCHPACLHEIRQ